MAPYTYKDNSANGLTKAIIDFLKLRGHFAERSSCTGRVIDKREIFTDVVGRTRQIGSLKWIPTSGTRGKSDISAVINSRSVMIEVKMRDAQEYGTEGISGEH